MTLRFSLERLPAELADEPEAYWSVYDNRYQKRIESWLSYEDAQELAEKLEDGTIRISRRA